MRSLARLSALAAAMVVITNGVVEAFYIGGGLTILSRNDLDGEPFCTHIHCETVS